MTSPSKSPFAHVKQGWFTIGEKRYYFRSQLEKECAEFLENQKLHDDIIGWKYEPKLFYFNSISRGAKTYRPDFFVMRTVYDFFWVECKGWMDPKSATKLKRFKKYYPKEKLLLVRNQKEFGNILEFDRELF